MLETGKLDLGTLAVGYSVGETSMNSETTTRPRIVCICGSGTFWEEIQRQRKILTLNGMIVIGPEINAKEVKLEDDTKYELDALHFHKINVADEVLVVDVDTKDSSQPSYRGESTKREAAYAKQSGKAVKYLSDTPNVKENTLRPLAPGLAPPDHSN